MTSLHDNVVARVRAYLAEGKLADGERISERALCEMLGVSRTPLREALKVLAAEGLVDLLPHRGARVHVLTETELNELFDLMGGLEALAGQLAAERITDEEIEEIEQLHHTMYGFYLRRDMEEYLQTNRAIHARIVAAARNSALAENYRNVAERIGRTRYSTRLADDRHRWAESMRDHEDILDLLRRRDGVGLADTLFRHLRHKQNAAIALRGEAPA
jgi:DNA-binding GntR family transcriptional regulator